MSKGLLDSLTDKQIEKLRNSDKNIPEADGLPVKEIKRREALKKLGLLATAIYVAPTILRIDRSARAQAPSQNGGGQSSCTPGQKKKGLC